MMSIARLVLTVSALALTSAPVFAQASSQTVSGTNPRPQTVSGTNPRPQTVSGTNPRPQTVSGTNPRPQSVMGSILAILGY